MVVAQLVERLLLIPEVRGLNPIIGKIYIDHLFTCLPSTVLYWKDENKYKEAGNGPHLKKTISIWKVRNVGNLGTNHNQMK